MLRSGVRAVDLVATLENGASSCLFESGYAAELGLDLTCGVMTYFRTANSSFTAYGHEVQIEVLGIEIHSLGSFFADYMIRKNGWGGGLVGPITCRTCRL